jgi:hypothetical protein
MAVEKNKQHVANAAEQAVRPLVRLLIHWGVGYKDFCELLKRTYMEEAEKSLREGSKEVTSSNLSLVSGIHRKDTSLYLNEGKKKFSKALNRPKSSAAFTVFSQWISHPRYKDLHGKAIALPYNAEKREKSFTGLCEEITSDLRPKSIMQELFRLDLIKEENGNLCIKQDAYIPHKNLEEKLQFFANNIGQHIEAASSNIMGQKDLKFERMAQHGGLSASDVSELKTIANEKAMNLLKEIYQLAGERASKNTKAEQEDHHEFSLGIFVNYSDKSKKTEKKLQPGKQAKKRIKP